MADIHKHDAPPSDPAEQSVQDTILQMLDDDAGLADDVKNAVLNALAAVADSADAADADAVPTYLTHIDVVGFRGIGGQARLDLDPIPGLTVVSGRNGSGKSSFAEALELALTGTSYRWLKKESMWADSWRNLHRPEVCAIKVGFAAEGTGPFTVGVDWPADAELTDRRSWTRIGAGDRVDGTASLGWSRPLELCRPVLSYDELGRLFDGGPSALYDALAKLLGLELLSDAEKWLATELKSSKDARGRADDERHRLISALADSTDERAERAIALLKSRGGASLDDVLALATGADAEGHRVASSLRKLTGIETPTLDQIADVSEQLRMAADSATAARNALVDSTSARMELLQAALRLHDHVGDTACPVCGRGHLDDDWASAARRQISTTEDALGEYRAASTAISKARAAAAALCVRAAAAPEIAGVVMTTLAIYNDAVAAVADKPDGATELASHLEATLTAVAAAADDLRAEAADLLKARDDSWTPLAAQLGAWVPSERAARELDPYVKTMAAAKKWMNERASPFRNLRLESIAAQARKIWGQLRQESNVDLGEITLQGTATRRRAVVGGSVDGQPTKALPVMSQGELHALALALFLPRATALASPFRFVVLDDPIQAMDPAKIDGFVRVLDEIAQTHQVVVFSHDDRLASIIRETGTDARLIEVVREAGSKVRPRPAINPALRQVNDVFAFIKDNRLPDPIKVRVMPGLFRLAVEAAAKQAYFTRQSLAGSTRAESEAAWESARKTATRLALAVHGDPTADLTQWLNAKPERKSTLYVCNSVHGDGVDASMGQVRELERTVLAVLALR